MRRSHHEDSANSVNIWKVMKIATGLPGKKEMPRYGENGVAGKVVSLTIFHVQYT